MNVVKLIFSIVFGKLWETKTPLRRAPKCFQSMIKHKLCRYFIWNILDVLQGEGILFLFLNRTTIYMRDGHIPFQLFKNKRILLLLLLLLSHFIFINNFKNYNVYVEFIKIGMYEYSLIGHDFYIGINNFIPQKNCLIYFLIM